MKFISFFRCVNITKILKFDWLKRFLLFSVFNKTFSDSSAQMNMCATKNLYEIRFAKIDYLFIIRDQSVSVVDEQTSSPNGNVIADFVIL